MIPQFYIPVAPTSHINFIDPSEFQSNLYERTGRWKFHEHNKFLEGMAIYGKNWQLISRFIQTRTVVQVRTHAQKYFLRLQQKGDNSMNVSKMLEDLRQRMTYNGGSCDSISSTYETTLRELTFQDSNIEKDKCFSPAALLSAKSNSNVHLKHETPLTNTSVYSHPNYDLSDKLFYQKRHLQHHLNIVNETQANKKMRTDATLLMETGSSISPSTDDKIEEVRNCESRSEDWPKLLCTCSTADFLDNNLDFDNPVVSCSTSDFLDNLDLEYDIPVKPCSTDEFLEKLDLDFDNEIFDEHSKGIENCISV